MARLTHMMYLYISTQILKKIFPVDSINQKIKAKIKTFEEKKH